MKVPEISNFIRTIMENDLESGKVDSIVTRFPPEPNAYLHIGHVRALVTNFELAKLFNGKTYLRFDDTNPASADEEYVRAIQDDIAWLGYKPDDVFFGSDYFEYKYEKAILLIKKGLAFVCDLTQDEISQYRGTLTEPGKESPYRNRSVEENLKLFTEMRDGKYKDGEKVLRAKIDMSSPNLNLRDPIIYRILHMDHHRQKDKWCIYPMYDFAHPLQDAYEGITHSLCSLEFENHRPLYDWFVEHCETEHKPQQIEFGRLNITNTVMSKRYLKALVEADKVTGYDDARMPTLAGLRRRGISPTAVKNFILSTGLSRINSTVESDQLDHFIREDFKMRAPRIMAVKDPLKVVITNYPENKVEYLDAINNPENESLGSRKIAFSRNLYIEREDFAVEKPNKRFRRLATGLEVRLMHAYFIKCNDVIYDEDGNILEIHCTYDEATKSGSGFNERRPNGTIHFVEATTAKSAQFNLFESLVIDAEGDTRPFIERLNPNSWEIKEGFVEGYQNDFQVQDAFQFVRDGYYNVDKLSTEKVVVFNRTVPLKSSYK